MIYKSLLVITVAGVFIWYSYNSTHFKRGFNAEKKLITISYTIPPNTKNPNELRAFYKKQFSSEALEKNLVSEHRHGIDVEFWFNNSNRLNVVMNIPINTSKEDEQRIIGYADALIQQSIENQ
jgi:hypothetical protein